jgi:MFS family permease
MAATGNTTIQTAVPDQLRGRVMSVYTTVFSASMPIGGLLMGAIASSLGILEAIAIGGVLSLASGIGALLWYQRIRGRSIAAPEVPVERQSTEPSTSAAFSPPKPNEVLSTRR